MHLRCAPVLLLLAACQGNVFTTSPGAESPPGPDRDPGDGGGDDTGLAEDGGQGDGGQGDGGNGGGDGGDWDGGTEDGGDWDGGSPDGGNPDGGSPDGGFDDGGSADGGSADGGSADGGSPELPMLPGDLVITELMIDPSAVDDSMGEWVELYNATDSNWDLMGFTLGDDGVDAWVLTDAPVIHSGEIVVLCAEPNPGINGGASCDGTFHYNTWGEGFALANTGDEVRLRDLDGTTIDRVSYDAEAEAVGKALGLDPDRTSADDNDAPSAWCDQGSRMSAGDRGTPGAVNDPC